LIDFYSLRHCSRHVPTSQLDSTSTLVERLDEHVGGACDGCVDERATRRTRDAVDADSGDAVDARRARLRSAGFLRRPVRTMRSNYACERTTDDD